MAKSTQIKKIRRLAMSIVPKTNHHQTQFRLNNKEIQNGHQDYQNGPDT
jgi:hypothetical protein